jgi:hypothetical protein
LHFADHQTVKHSVGEYVRAEVHINTIGGALPVFKRGMKGIYQHCGIEGKRLTYHQTDGT